MSRMKAIIKLTLCLTIFLAAKGIRANDPDKKYERIVARADKFYDAFVYPKAIELYQKAIDKAEDEFDPYAALQIADSYRLMNKPVSAENWYEKLEGSDVLTDRHKLNYSQVLLKNGNEDKARAILEQMNNPNEVDMNRLKGINEMQEFYADSSAFFIETMNINSDQNDFAPAFYKSEDQEGLMFVSNRKTHRLGQSTYYWDETYFLDLFYTKIEDGVNSQPEPISRRINTIFHEGPAVFYDNGQKVIFTRNNFNLGKRGASIEGVNMLKLFYSERNKRGKWSTAVPLPFNSDNYSVGHPAITSDGKTLYFSADMEGTVGKADLYKAVYENGEWSTPVNLGKVINTAEDELFPFISDENVLYFASEGHPGIGGLDVYKVDLNEESLQIVNMGFPVNTESDDFGFIIEGLTGYFSSDRAGGDGSDDIYKVSISRLDMQAQLVDAETGEVLRGQAKIVDQRQNQLVSEMVNEELSPAFQLMRGRILAVEASAEGYKDIDYIFNTLEVPRGTMNYVMKVPMDKINLKGDILIVSNPGSKDQVIALRDDVDFFDGSPDELRELYKQEYVDLENIYNLQSIYYDFDRSTIRKDAASELDKLVRILARYEQMKVMLSAHTDSRGSSDYNKKLAVRRAKAAQTYLVENGISENRVQIDYFGESRLVNDCADGVNCAEGSHQQNRRTEVRMLE